MNTDFLSRLLSVLTIMQLLSHLLLVLSNASLRSFNVGYCTFVLLEKSEIVYNVCFNVG